mgnify:CR=1 FL=1
MIKPLTLLLSLVSFPVFMSSGATVIYGLAPGISSPAADGANQHFMFVSPTAFTVAGGPGTVDSWSMTAANPGADVRPIIYTATGSGGSGDTFTIAAVGPVATGSVVNNAWGATLPVGTYHFGFAQDSNVVNFGNSGGANPIPMNFAWVFGDSLNDDDAGGGPGGGPSALTAGLTVGAEGTATTFSPATNPERDEFGNFDYSFFNVGVRFYDISFEVTTIPEPSASMLALVGFGILLRRRRC